MHLYPTIQTKSKLGLRGRLSFSLMKWASIASIAATALLCASPAHAVYNIVLAQSGSNVVATGSGSINTAGLTITVSPIFCGLGTMTPNGLTICAGAGTANLYTGATSPGVFGSGGSTVGSGATGDPVFLQGANVYIKTGYVSGTALSGTTTWNSTTLAGLGVTVGTYTWTFGSGANADKIVLYAGTSPDSTAVTPPLVGPLMAPGVTGVVGQPSSLDLSTYSGPKMVNCLLTTVQQMTGQTGTYLGQQASGAARVSLSDGTILSFYPLSANTTTGSGIGFTGTNAMNVATSCGSFSVAPAIYKMAEFGNAVNGMSGTLQIDSNGVMNTFIGGQTFVARPDYIVTQGGNRSGLALNADGSYSMNYSDGSVQLLRPAFLDTTALQNDATTTFLGTLTIQLDGSAVFTQLNGTQMTWTPEYVLTPTTFAAPVFVNDATNHYKYRTAASYQGMSSR